MLKTTAIALLSQDITDEARRIAAVAERLGVTRQAVYAWPDQLPTRTANRVLAVCVRLDIAEKLQLGESFHPVVLDAVAP